MPGFGDDLGDEEIWNILAFIQSTWPELQLQLQAERTRFDNERGGN
jgi:mono/diheme cytochrome c family protein